MACVLSVFPRILLVIHFYYILFISWQEVETKQVILRDSLRNADEKLCTAEVSRRRPAVPLSPARTPNLDGCALYMVAGMLGLGSRETAIVSS